MGCYMIAFIAFDFVLWIVFGGVMGVTLVIKILKVHSDDLAGNATAFGIPSDVIAYFKLAGHFHLLAGTIIKPQGGAGFM